MNRASLALGLLLGTVAAALVAAGVARDLERAELRSVGTVVVAAVPVLPKSEPRLPVSVRKVVDLDRHLHFPVPADPVVLLPVTTHTLKVDLNSWMKHFVAVPKFEAAKNERPLPRVIFNRRKLARLLAKSNAGDTKVVDDLIRENDGIDDLRDAGIVPFGHVVIRGKLIELEHRGPREKLELAWTGRLHYGLDPRQTLRHLDPMAALIATKAERLPGETPKLWSDDRRAAIDAITNTLRDAGRGTIALVEQVAVVVALGQWANDQVDVGLELVARHVKREAWLVNVPRPAKTAPVQSAQRLKGGKG